MTKGKKNNEKTSYCISVRIINYIVKHIFKNVGSANSFTTSPFHPPTYFQEFFFPPQCTVFIEKLDFLNQHIWNQKGEGNCLEQKYKLNSIN